MKITITNTSSNIQEHIESEGFSFLGSQIINEQDNWQSTKDVQRACIFEREGKYYAYDGRLFSIETLDQDIEIELREIKEPNINPEKFSNS